MREEKHNEAPSDETRVSVSGLGSELSGNDIYALKSAHISSLSTGNSHPRRLGYLSDFLNSQRCLCFSTTRLKLVGLLLNTNGSSDELIECQALLRLVVIVLARQHSPCS